MDNVLAQWFRIGHCEQDYDSCTLDPRKRDDTITSTMNMMSFLVSTSKTLFSLSKVTEARLQHLKVYEAVASAIRCYEL